MHKTLARALYFSLQFLRREPISKALSYVERTEFLPLEKLRVLQASRMIAQLQFAMDNVPHYQKEYRPFRARIQNLKNWQGVNELLNELPVVSKDDVQRDGTQFTALNANQLHTYPDKTSGSTGTPLVFPCDQQAWAYRHASFFRQLRMFGIEVGEPYALFFGLHWDKKTQRQVMLRDRIFNRVRVSAFDLEKNTFHSYLKNIIKHAPTFFFGYPSALYDFCFLAQELEIDLHDLKLKAVVTTAEPLLDFQRSLIEEMTGARCTNQYGSAEGGSTAFECPEGNMHVNIETTWLRLREPSESSREGIVTDMLLRAFPLINYAIEDEITFKEGNCSCGRTHPMLASISGRSGEPIHLPNGRKINANLPSYIFKPLAPLRVIQRYRFVQQGQVLKLFLVVAQKFTQEHLSLVEQEVKAAFGSDISFTTHIVPELETLPNAKHKSFVVIPEKAVV